MYILRRFHKEKFGRINAIIDGLYQHLTNYINLIGSATLPFPEVGKVLALPSTACRVEGHVKNRFFPGSFPIDEAEYLGEESIRRLLCLGKDYDVSLQPHSATQSNHIVCRSILSPGDIVMGLSIKDGGHISHVLGLPTDVTFVPFPLNDQGIDYDALEEIAKITKPKMIIGGASSYPLSINYHHLGMIADRVGAFLHADLAHTCPFIISGIHPAVIPYADTITIDTGKNLRGPKGGILVYNNKLGDKTKRSIFPLTQSSPNQSSLIAKACMLQAWENNDIVAYSNSLIASAKSIAEELQRQGITLVFGGTESHLILLDLREVALSSKEGERALETNHILVNCNAIPNDPMPPWAGSGLRLGVTTLAILNYNPADIILLGTLIGEIIRKQIVNHDIIDYLLNKYHKNIANISNE